MRWPFGKRTAAVAPALATNEDIEREAARSIPNVGWEAAAYGEVDAMTDDQKDAYEAEKKAVLNAIRHARNYTGKALRKSKVRELLGKRLTRSKAPRGNMEGMNDFAGKAALNLGWVKATEEELGAMDREALGRYKAEEDLVRAYYKTPSTVDSLKAYYKDPSIAIKDKLLELQALRKEKRVVTPEYIGRNEVMSEENAKAAENVVDRNKRLKALAPTVYEDNRLANSNRDFEEMALNLRPLHAALMKDDMKIFTILEACVYGSMRSATLDMKDISEFLEENLRDVIDDNTIVYLAKIVYTVCDMTLQNKLECGANEVAGAEAALAKSVQERGEGKEKESKFSLFSGIRYPDIKKLYTGWMPAYNDTVAVDISGSIVKGLICYRRIIGIILSVTDKVLANADADKVLSEIADRDAEERKAEAAKAREEALIRYRKAHEAAAKTRTNVKAAQAEKNAIQAERLHAVKLVSNGRNLSRNFNASQLNDSIRNTWKLYNQGTKDHFVNVWKREREGRIAGIDRSAVTAPAAPAAVAATVAPAAPRVPMAAPLTRTTRRNGNTRTTAAANAAAAAAARAVGPAAAMTGRPGAIRRAAALEARKAWGSLIPGTRRKP